MATPDTFNKMKVMSRTLTSGHQKPDAMEKSPKENQTVVLPK